MGNGDGGRETGIDRYGKWGLWFRTITGDKMKGETKMKYPLPTPSLTAHNTMVGCSYFGEDNFLFIFFYLLNDFVFM